MRGGFLVLHNGVFQEQPRARRNCSEAQPVQDMQCMLCTHRQHTTGDREGELAARDYGSLDY